LHYRTARVDLAASPFDPTHRDMATGVNSGALASHRAALARPRENFRVKSRSSRVSARSAARSRRSRATPLAVRAGPVTDLPDEQRVVITGAGVVSTHGDSREIFFDNLLAGKSGAVDLTAWKPGVFDDLPTRIGAPVQELDYGDDLTAKEARRMDRVHQYAICAGKRALRDAGLWGADLEALDKTRCGVLVGSAMGGMQVYEDNVMALNTKGIKKVSPFTVPYLLTNMSGAILGMQAELGFRGPNYAGAFPSVQPSRFFFNRPLLLALLLPLPPTVADERRFVFPLPPPVNTAQSTPRARRATISSSTPRRTSAPARRISSSRAAPRRRARAPASAASSRAARSPPATTTRPARPARGIRAATASSWARAPASWSWSP